MDKSDDYKIKIIERALEKKARLDEQTAWDLMRLEGIHKGIY